jgi:Tol biopolymer transport system component
MATDRHERVLRQFFLEEASAAVPPDLLDRSLARTATARRRPGWYGRIRDGRLARPGAVGRSGVRLAYVLVILGLVLAALLLAVAAGAFRRDPVTPLGRNGAIAYWFQGNNRSGNSSVVMMADGTGFRTLAGAFCPSFSADGNALAYVLDDSSTVIANPDGSSPRPVAGIRPADLGLGPDSGHALSPDGTQIAWWSPRDELWVSPTAGGPAVRIVPPSGDPQERLLAPVWSRDGLRIAFARATSIGAGDAAFDYRSAIDVVDADGSNLRHLTTRPGTWTDAGMIAWAPDGRSVVYTGVQDRSPIPQPSAGGYATPNDIFVIGVDGTGDRPLTSTPGDESQPAWSPDGRQLAWVSQVGDAQKLTTIGMDGRTPLGSAVQGPESGWFTWSPDGTALLFAGRRDGGQGGGALMLVAPDLRQAPTALRDLDGTLLCPPSWQRLNP